MLNMLPDGLTLPIARWSNSRPTSTGSVTFLPSSSRKITFKLPEDAPVPNGGSEISLSLQAVTSLDSANPPSPSVGPSIPETSDGTSPTNPLDDAGNGRRNSRFSFTSILGALRDDGSKSSQRQDELRGRRPSKGKGKECDGEPNTEMEVEKDGKRWSTLGKRGYLPWLEGEPHKESGNGWKEFKRGASASSLPTLPTNDFCPGVYTYPISFSIPGDAPSTLSCDFGSITWRLKANAHRPGVFTSKITASREVMLISTPGEEDTEETDNIIVERFWETQLYYLISISGRSFPVGGIVPVNFTFMPMEKVQIYRISIVIEGKVFISHFYRNVRTLTFGALE